MWEKSVPVVLSIARDLKASVENPSLLLGRLIRLPACSSDSRWRANVKRLPIVSWRESLSSGMNSIIPDFDAEY